MSHESPLSSPVGAEKLKTSWPGSEMESWAWAAAVRREKVRVRARTEEVRRGMWASASAAVEAAFEHGGELASFVDVEDVGEHGEGGACGGDGAAEGDGSGEGGEVGPARFEDGVPCDPCDERETAEGDEEAGGGGEEFTGFEAAGDSGEGDVEEEEVECGDGGGGDGEPDVVLVEDVDEEGIEASVDGDGEESDVHRDPVAVDGGEGWLDDFDAGVENEADGVPAEDGGGFDGFPCFEFAVFVEDGDDWVGEDEEACGAGESEERDEAETAAEDIAEFGADAVGGDAGEDWDGDGGDGDAEDSEGELHEAEGDIEP